MSRKGEASTLILMLGSAFFVAAIVVVGLVFYFSGSGTHRVESLILSPKEMVDGKIEFIHVDPHGRGWTRIPVSNETYHTFYHQIRTVRSLAEVTDSMVQQFQLTPPSTLTLQKKGFVQQIEFLPGNLFRLMLHPEIGAGQSEEEWVYFSKPHVYDGAVKLFGT